MSASAQQVTFNHLTVEDGLSQNSVMATVQDGRGMLWFGTRYGLNKYDARKFKAYHNNHNATSLSDDYIVSLLSDSKKNLWVGTQNGLDRYNERKDIFERVAVNVKSANGGKIVNVIFEDKKGRIWVAMDKSLMVLDNKASNGFILAQSFTDRTVKCILEDHAGMLWVGTSKGLMKQLDNSPHFSLSESGIDGRLQSENINSIVEDSSRHLWLGTLGNGLKRYDPITHKTESFIHEDNNPASLINNNVRKLLFDHNGKLWVGTQEGLSIKNANNRFTNLEHSAVNKTSLSQNSVYSLYEDKQSTMWIGTFFGGINSFDAYTTPFKVYQSGGKNTDLSNNVVSSIIEDGLHNLWVGTEGGGLNYKNQQTGQVTYFQHKDNDPASISSNLVKFIYKDRDDNIWAGTHGGGLNLFNQAKGNFVRYFYKDKDVNTLNSEITSIKEDAEARFWVGTQTGLKVFKRQGRLLLPDSKNQDIVKVLDKSMIFYLFLDSQRKLWIGTDTALYILKGDHLKFISRSSPQSKASFMVNCITEDTGKNIWVGTYYNGLHKYTIDGVFKQSLTQKDGLPDNNIVGILEDSKRKLWISTGNGLSKYEVSKRLFSNYYIIDGLAGNVFNNNAFYRSQSGEMFFGGYNGLTSFIPQNIKQNTTIPSVILYALNVLGKPVTVSDNASILPQDISLTKSIELPHDQNVFGVEFSVLNYIKSGKNRYAYQLQGFDKEWNYTDNPSINFTNLPPGNYSLLMKGSNNDGFWSSTLVLNIKILPPFWKTWKAYTLYCILFGIFVFFITRYFFLSEWVKKNDELTQLKLNFFTNISHEIRTHLSLIIGPAEKLIIDGSGTIEDRQQLYVIKNNSDSLLQLVNELMDFRRAETGNLKLSVSQWDIVPFIREIHALFYDLSVKRNIVAYLTSATETVHLWFDREQLEKVFFNLLSNAFKFTGNGGQITIGIEEDERHVKITITDNGKGISKENLDKLFENYFQEEHHGVHQSGYGIGLALSKSIVEMHKGNIEVNSSPATENQETITTFTVTLRKGKEHFDDSYITEATSYPGPSGLQVKATEQVNVIPVASPQAGETKHTILLVEDNAEIRSFITAALNHQYNFITAENGLEGWNTATEIIPDLIISDVMMPEMDGITFCRLIKTDERTSHIPVILLTAKSSTSNFVTGLQTGADIYLAKPFSLQILSLHIYNIIAARERLWLQFSKAIELPKLINQNQLFSPVESTEVLHPIDATFLEKVIKLIEEHMYEPEFNIATLSSKVAMSQPVLFKKIKAITGLSTNDFVKSLRLKKAAELLLQKRHTVYEVSYMVGYEDSKYFSKEFKKYFGELPSAYAEKHY